MFNSTSAIVQSVSGKTTDTTLFHSRSRSMLAPENIRNTMLTLVLLLVMYWNYNEYKQPKVSGVDVQHEAIVHEISVLQNGEKIFSFE